MSRPRKIRIDASTACQLRCRCCPTSRGDVGQHLGTGFLTLQNFKRIVDGNRFVSAVELANWGEIFLNPELLQIIRYAHARSIALYASTGVNLNHADETVLEALVRCRFRGLTCSIDGASQETYGQYRIGGDFRQVIDNIKTINRFKLRYHSPYPRLKWQFIAFGHNEHEISHARTMAEDLNMAFEVKLSWEDLYTESFAPIKNAELIRRQTGLGVATRGEFRAKNNREYFWENSCLKLWISPQINYDGRILGCPVNFWGDYGNAFETGGLASLDNEKMAYAKEMLMGIRESREDIPCSQCTIYQRMRRTGTWVTARDLLDQRPNGRTLVCAENMLLNLGSTARMVSAWSEMGGLRNGPAYLTRSLTDLKRSIDLPRLRSQITSLDLPLATDGDSGWRPYPLFKGHCRRIGRISCHASVLTRGQCPHPPHRHKEEEILLLLRGEVDITLPDHPSANGTHTRRLKPGDVVYYPAFFAHTLRTVSDQPANYIMFKWHDRQHWSNDSLPFIHVGRQDLLRKAQTADGFAPRTIFEGRTQCLRRLQCHVSTLTPHAGYPAHRDRYNVAIVVLEGEVETLGQCVGPHGVIFYAAGEPHGMHNPGETTARYIVFELEGRPRSSLQRQLDRASRLMSNARDPRRWGWLLQRWAGYIRGARTS